MDSPFTGHSAQGNKAGDKEQEEGRLPYDPEGILIFGDAAMTETTPETQSKVSYKQIENVYITPTDLYLYHSSVQAYSLPAHVFSCEEEQVAFVSYLRTRIAEEKSVYL